MTENQTSIYQKYQEATSRYYHSDVDPLSYAPVALNKDVAHSLALLAEQSLNRIVASEDDINAEALGKQREAYERSDEKEQMDILTRKDNIIRDRLRSLVVEVEINHAQLAPGDFGEASVGSPAYQIAAGTGQRAPDYPE